MKFFLSVVILTMFHQGYSQAEYELGLDLNIGDKYFIVTNVNSVTTQDVMNEVQVIKKDNSFTYDYEVVEKPDNSSYYIRLAFKRFVTTFEVDNEVFTFDSDSTYEDEHQLNKLYSFIIEKNIFFLSDNKGKILRIDSLDNIYNNFINNIGSSDAEIKSFNELFGAQSITNLLNLFSFPEKNVKENELWTNNDSITSGILKITDSNFLIAKIQSKSYTIRKTSKLSTDKNKSIAMNKIYLNYMISGIVEGEDIIDKKTCMIIQSKSTQEASGMVSMKYNENSDPAYSWPIIIKNTIILKTTKIEK